MSREGAVCRRHTSGAERNGVQTPPHLRQDPETCGLPRFPVETAGFGIFRQDIPPDTELFFREPAVFPADAGQIRRHIRPPGPQKQAGSSQKF